MDTDGNLKKLGEHFQVSMLSAKVTKKVLWLVLPDKI